MIEVKTFKTGKNSQSMKCKTEGTLMELAYDTLFIMRHIWKIIDRDSHDAAAIFAACITDAVNGRDGFNLWCAPECEVEIGVRSTWDEEAAPS